MEKRIRYKARKRGIKKRKEVEGKEVRKKK